MGFSVVRFVRSFLVPIGIGLIVALSGRAQLDLNGNQQSDVWEARFNAPSLAPTVDSDGDGFSNAAEAIAGTDPLARSSCPTLGILFQGATAVPTWESVARKRYQVLGAPALGAGNLWQPIVTVIGTGGTLSAPRPGPARFFRLAVEDVDSDGDDLTDWEEQSLGFDGASPHTERQDQPDLPRVQAGWLAANFITVALLDGEMSERWPDPGVVAIRRSGGLKPVTVNIALGGTATAGADFGLDATTSAVIPAGSREVWVSFAPVADAADAEPAETITLTALAGAGYSLGASVTATVNLANETATSPPNAKAAARFLVQAAPRTPTSFPRTSRP